MVGVVMEQVGAPAQLNVTASEAVQAAVPLIVAVSVTLPVLASDALANCATAPATVV
jgi:hypothetical protein